eukprot:Skav203741  [mRNA]  locus=scaffold68:438449:441475:+ [translate_table: standard]
MAAMSQPVLQQMSQLMANCGDQPMLPTPMAPKALAPPVGLVQPGPLRTYLEPPLVGGDSLGGNHQSEAWRGFQMPQALMVPEALGPSRGFVQTEPLRAHLGGFQMPPTLLVPKALAPPVGLVQPEPLRTYLEPPLVGGDSLGGSHQSEAWQGFQIPYPRSGFGAPNGGVTEPVTNVTNLQRMAGVSAKQDKEILDTLRSSGLALNLKSLDMPEVDISQMLNMSMAANQGSAQPSMEGSTKPPVTAPVAASPEPVSVPKPAQVRVTSSSMTAAEEYLRSYRPQPQAQRLTYPRGVSVDFSELAPVMRVVAIANSQSRSRILGAIENGLHVRTAMQVFRECDRDGCGFLTWSNGQIRDFVVTVFMQLGLVPPAEMQTYAAHTLFDMNRSMCLSACDCLCLVDVMLRAIALVDDQVEQVPRRPRSRSPAWHPAVPHGVSSPVAEELAHAQAETERLRQELEEVKAAEAAAEADRPFTDGFLEPDTAALLSTAKAHAENRRLERELKNLRALASRQRGEVEWLNELKQQLNSSRQEELKEEHLRLMEMQQEEVEEAALRQEQEMKERRQRRLEALVQERSERRRRLEQREKELQEQELLHCAEEEKLQQKEQDLQRRELELHKETERSIQQAEALRGRELDISKEIGRLKAASARPEPVTTRKPVISPRAMSDVEPEEEEPDADAAEAAAMAAAQSLENRKLRRELENLRALAHWQQTEVGAAIACKSAASRESREEPSTVAAHSSKPRGALVMAALAGEAIAGHPRGWVDGS